MGETQYKFLEANLENAGIKVENEGKKQWLNTAFKGRDLKINRLVDLNLQDGDIVKVNGSKGFWNSIELVKRNTEVTEQSVNKENENKDNTTQKKKVPLYGELNEQSYLSAKQGAQRNAVAILDIMQRLGQLQPENNLDNLRRMKEKDLYKQLTGKEWGDE